MSRTIFVQKLHEAGIQDRNLIGIIVDYGAFDDLITKTLVQWPASGILTIKINKGEFVQFDVKQCQILFEKDAHEQDPYFTEHLKRYASPRDWSYSLPQHPSATALHHFCVLVALFGGRGYDLCLEILMDYRGATIWHQPIDAGWLGSNRVVVPEYECHAVFKRWCYDVFDARHKGGHALLFSYISNFHFPIMAAEKTTKKNDDDDDDDSSSEDDLPTRNRVIRQLETLSSEAMHALNRLRAFMRKYDDKLGDVENRDGTLTAVDEAYDRIYNMYTRNSDEGVHRLDMQSDTHYEYNSEVVGGDQTLKKDEDDD